MNQDVIPSGNNGLMLVSYNKCTGNCQLQVLGRYFRLVKGEKLMLSFSMYFIGSGIQGIKIS